MYGPGAASQLIRVSSGQAVLGFPPSEMWLGNLDPGTRGPSEAFRPLKLIGVVRPPFPTTNPLAKILEQRDEAT